MNLGTIQEITRFTREDHRCHQVVRFQAHQPFQGCRPGCCSRTLATHGHWQGGFAAGMNTHYPWYTTRVKRKIQFHWNDYSDKGYLTALSHLCDLKMEGVISAIGLCNFDAIRTDEICTQLGPGAIVSNQVQVRVISVFLVSAELSYLVLNYRQSPSSRYVRCLRETRPEAINLWDFGELWWLL